MNRIRNEEQHPRKKCMQSSRIVCSADNAKQLSSRLAVRSTLAVWIAVAALCACASEARAQPQIVAINPGVKIGWTLGSGGGLYVGAELSISVLDKRWNGVGLVFNAYRSRGHNVFHVGAELSFQGIGFQLGPTFVKRPGGGVRSGISAELYCGFILIPYFERTFLFNGDGWQAGGFYFKVPIPLSGNFKRFSMGG
jgi:hypothetical protein